jgi:hypothetical protein
MQKHRDRFEKIILYPSKQHGTTDLEDFWLKVFPETWVVRDPDLDYIGKDWRQLESEPLVELSDAEWMFFTEADFFVADWGKFFNDVERAMETSDMVGCWSPSQFPYMHPCCLFMKREFFERTDKDFRAHPEILGSDHFAMFTRDAERLGAKMTKLEDMGYKEWDDYFHLGGLTYTFQDWKGNGKDIFGMKSHEAYYVYLHFAANVDVPQSIKYLRQAKEIQDTLAKRFPDLDLENNKWTKFFQTS